MSLPRPIFKRELYLITRRTAERQFLLRPSRRRNREIEYCLAVAAQRHGIEVHAVVVMSNHWHCVASDPEGRVPDFLRDMHGWTAKTVNKSLGRWASVWSSSQTSLVRASGDDNVIERIVYTMANPVKAGRVAKGGSWPRLRMCWPAKRPTRKRPTLFRKRGPMPKEATLELARPPGFADMDDASIAEILFTAVERREAYHRDVLAREGRKPIGRRAVRAQSCFDKPASRDPRRRMSPRVAEKDKWRRVEALQRLRWFLDAYRVAFTMWRAGGRDVVFPAGTYGPRVNSGVRVAPG